MLVPQGNPKGSPQGRKEGLWDCLVVGDEVESILTAVSAARCGARVLLVREDAGMLGGLCTRGGLSYMDITPEFKSPLFREFTDRAGVVRVALEAGRAHDVLTGMLAEAGVTVFSLSGETPHWQPPKDGLASLSLSGGRTLYAQSLIDTTPDGDIARQAGIPYIRGLGGVLGPDQDALGVSPVFRIAGVDYRALMAFEAGLRQQAELPQWLVAALPFHPPALRDAYLAREAIAPETEDYLDILNPVIGIDYHVWRHGDPTTYPDAPIAIDGANIARLSDGTLGFNGMVMRPDFGPEADVFDTLLTLSQGGETPDVLNTEMQAFERYLRERGGFADARVIPPQALYVRQTLTLLAEQNVTAAALLGGGVASDEAVGTFSYWLDLRGAQLWRHYPGEDLPKPVFNVGLKAALPPAGNPEWQGLAFVSRSAGYSPIAQGACRIVQHNALLGEALGIAAALAAQAGTSLRAVEPIDVRAVLAERQGRPVALSGHATLDGAAMARSRLLARDAAIVANPASFGNTPGRTPAPPVGPRKP